MREITHLHFAAWPDFGSPAQPSHLLALVELANVMQRAALPVDSASVMRSPTMEAMPITWYDEPEQDTNARPMLVHCSAGCGRTGTFCTVDSVIDMLKRERQARSRGNKGHDHEGDISMDDAVSPRTTMQGFFSASPRRSSMEKGKRTSQSSPSIDTAWMHDDSVDLIQRTVEDFREQRISMVQSLRQYVLCYETVMEWITRMNERTSNTPGGRQRSGSLQQPSRDH
jgi:protein-tyrosine phosphatase